MCQGVERGQQGIDVDGGWTGQGGRDGAGVWGVGRWGFTWSLPPCHFPAPGPIRTAFHPYYPVQSPATSFPSAPSPLMARPCTPAPSMPPPSALSLPRPRHGRGRAAGMGQGGETGHGWIDVAGDWTGQRGTGGEKARGQGRARGGSHLGLSHASNRAVVINGCTKRGALHCCSSQTHMSRLQHVLVSRNVMVVVHLA